MEADVATTRGLASPAAIEAETGSTAGLVYPVAVLFDWKPALRRVFRMSTAVRVSNQS